MQIKIYTIPIGDNGTALAEMNSFLISKKILDIQSHLISNENGACWCFCIRYIEQTINSPNYAKSKVDYKQLLEEAVFTRFSILREIRKKVAADEGIPAFAVFTDEELAGLAKLKTINAKNMLIIKGIGEKKVERFAKYFIDKPEKNEAAGTVT